MKRRPLLPVLIAFVTISVAWNFLVPAYENLDEMEHAEVVRHVAVTRRLPIHGEAEEAGFRVRQEASQPPLYYLVGALWVKLLDLPLDPPEREPIPGAVVACGPSGTFYNKATWARDPYAGFPWSGHVRTVHGLRLLSTLLQLFTVAGVWVLGRFLFPRGFVPLVATLMVAFNPQFLLVASGVNNDNLVTPLATWALVLLLHTWREGPTPARLLGLGALAGLAGLSKLSGLALLGLSGLVLLVYAWREGRSFLDLARWGVLLALPAALLMAPWVIHNLRTYGDPTALSPMLEEVGRRPSSRRLLGEFGLMWRSYWGQLPCSFYPRVLYWPFTLLVVGGMIGVILRWRRLSPTQREGLVLLAGWFVVIVAAWVRWNLLTPAPGGRLLFPASASVALIVAAGWAAPLVRTRRHSRTGSLLPLLWGAFLPLWALVALRLGPVLLFAPPRRLPAEVALPNPVDFVFGDAISLEGYEAHLERPRWPCWLASEAYCRPGLSLTLYWKALRPLDEDWVLGVQLVSTAPGENDLRFSYDRWPGHGNLPTSAMPVGPVLEERYLWPLPEGAFVTQAWDLEVSFLDLETEDRLPVTTAEGEVGGNTARLTTLRIPGMEPACPEAGELASPARFADAVALTHAGVEPAEGGRQVLLCWESLAPLSEDYTVFVHAYDEEGVLLVTGDGPPMNQAFPIHLWQPGDKIADEHVVPLQEGMAPARIAVGLYHPQTGARLPATMEGRPLPDDAFIVWRAER